MDARAALLVAFAFAVAGCGTDYVGLSRQLALDSDPPGVQPTVEHVKSFYHNDPGRPRLDTVVLLLPNGTRVKHGRELEWYDDGQLRWERQFDHGEPSGVWRSWHDNGNPRSEAAFGSDELTEMIWWHENGQVSTKGEAQSGIRQGTWTSWYADGTKRWEGLYRDNLREGTWTYWEPDGTLQERGLFRADERIGSWARDE